ncbi:nitroreductase [Roseomonas sp. CECT 9278]|uniref:nitroreductase n=1 Tax=Roseomonas sp. CECT 9278 TaxID=2845823 RepID=UPI001E57B1BF|nr:nitroreductase [Roseomonas sp. CECT 9278]CAH0251655.1 Chloronitrobenzene nitroreductase [Roseomonas sp. CECT 9278]
MTAEEAIASRRSIRAFLPTPVPRDVVERILDIAARAPSGTNMQPWRAHALAGAPLRALADALVAQAAAKVEAEYRYYPAEFFEPYLSRRRKVGWDLYGLLGIARGESGKMQRQHAKNLTFFGAPVGIIFTIDRRLEIGSWLDTGMFLGNVMALARAQGLDTCPQAAFAPHHATIRAMIGIPETEVVVCGMALGHADPAAPENTLVTDRAPAAEFCSFAGWDDR